MKDDKSSKILGNSSEENEKGNVKGFWLCHAAPK